MLKLHFLTKMSNSALTRTISYRELRKLLINFENEYKERKVFRRFSSRSPTSREMTRIRERFTKTVILVVDNVHGLVQAFLRH